MSPFARSTILRLSEVILGGLFIYAGYLKVFHPYEFAEAVLAYRLLPAALVGLAAAVLPWLELLAGFSLAAGFKKRSCLLLLGTLGGIFWLVLLITMARGLKIDCGCGLFFTRQVGLVPLLEDGLILLWAASLYYWELPGRAGVAAASGSAAS